MDNYWDKDYGDRRQEMVFIGLSEDMDQDAISAQLNACLVEDYLCDPDLYRKVRDPFPEWFKTAS